MAIMREAIVLVVFSCIAATVAGYGEDGLPRPLYFPDAPTTSYGPEPQVKYSNGSLVNCTWYGFANEQYSDSIGETCLQDLRAVLSNATEDLGLEPYAYYYFSGPIGSDPATKEPYCYEGCFNLNGGALSPSNLESPASAPDSYIRGPSLAPYYLPNAPTVAPPPQAGA